MHATYLECSCEIKQQDFCVFLRVYPQVGFANRDRAVALIASGECTHGIAAFMSKTDPDFPAP